MPRSCWRCWLADHLAIAAVIGSAVVVIAVVVGVV